MKINEISSMIIEECIHIHKTLGPGLFETVYEKILAHRLRKCGLFIEEQKPLPVFYEDIKMDVGYRTDILVEYKVLIEIKSMEELPKVVNKQMTTYLRLLDYRVGLLINFNVDKLADGIHRYANKYVEE